MHDGSTVHVYLTERAFINRMLKSKTLGGSSRASSPTHNTKSNTLELTSGANHHDNNHQHQQQHHNGTYYIVC